MKPADFGLLFLVCLFWALNLVVTRWTVTAGGVPPFFFATIRMGLLAATLSPFILPGPRQIGLMFVIAMGLGAVQFAFLFIGLVTAPAGVAGVVGQLGVPLTTILSIMVLGERIGVYRAVGIILSFAGVMIIMFDPAKFSLTMGVIYLVLAALAGAIANIVMKRIDPMPAMRLQAWVGLFSFPLLLVASLAFEHDQARSYFTGDWRVFGASLFAVAGVSIFAHGNFYRLIKRYDVTLLSPLTLMSPVLSVILGAILLGEPLSAREIVGAVIAIAGVGVIGVRRNRRFPEAAVGDKIGP
jgi:O-acetylserine/cysteine efflux transporter